jgi:hypothetical protein
VLINGADLLQKHNGILLQTGALSMERNVRGQVCFVALARDGRRDHRGTEPVAHIVLHNKHGAHAALLAAHHGA